MIAICFPFLASIVLKPFRIKIAIFYVYISVGILYIPRAFSYYIKWEFSSLTNSTIATLVASDLLTSYSYVVYSQAISSTIAIIIPTGTILACTCMIVIKSTHSYRNMKTLSSSDSRSKKIKYFRSVFI